MGYENFTTNNTEFDKPAENQIEEKNMIFQEQEIRLLSEKEVEFSEQHIGKMEEIFAAFAEINPDILNQYDTISSCNKDTILRKIFPLNAENIPSINRDKWEIRFYKRGMDLSIPHRVSSSQDSEDSGFINNFSGTLAHELTHGGSGAHLFSDLEFNKRFIEEWRDKFGWKQATVMDKNDGWKTKPIEGWRKNEDGTYQKDDYISAKGHYTTMPEKCIGGKNSYAASMDVFEDICDSVAAFLLNPSILDEEKCQFLKDKIAEYHELIKNKSEV